jgi:hypothetical protein
MQIRRFAAIRRLLSCFLAFGALTAFTGSATAQLVPGTGAKLDALGDDFEDAEWKFHLNWPKGSYENDESHRHPAGVSANRRWFEGPKRGEPDHIVRVATPDGGLPGSEGALLMRSLYSGTPYHPSYKMQQDDLIARFPKGPIPFWRNPSVVVQVYMPPIEQWEPRQGPTFAFRAACEPSNPKPKSRKDRNKPDTYWPGLILDYRPAKSAEEPATPMLRVRARENGGDYDRVAIKQTGWWTWGMSFTSDGRVHYYAKPGIGDLTQQDHIASHYPYGYRGSTLDAFFFCVCNKDDGKTWSTPWIVDDPSVYYVPSRSEARRR